MKPNVILYILTACTSFLASCHRHDYFTISGYVYEDCSLTPVPLYYLELFQGISGGLGPTSGGFLVSGYTDSTGYFELTYQSQNSTPIEIREKSATIMSNIPSNEDMEGLEVFLGVVSNIQVSLNVLQPYSAGDTLYISDLNPDATDMLKIPCPLSSGVLYTVPNIPVYNLDYAGNYETINWWINADTGANNQKTLYIDQYCSDTVFVTVDIF